MSQPAHLHPSDLHGLSRLALDGVIGTTRLVEHLHHTISRVSAPIGRPARGQTRGITGLVYRSIHGVTGLVGGTADFAFGQIVPRLTPASSSPQRERFLAVLNGVLGDHLETSDNPLAIPMAFRHRGQRLDLSGEVISNVIERPQRRLLISLHGLCMNDLRWHEGGESMPDKLAAALGYTPLYLHYNSGRHVSSNGRELAEQLEQLVNEWPQPIDDIVLLGHSMGGLIARSACHYGLVEKRDWLDRVSTLITLGTPHHGAPLERIGNKVDHLLAISPYIVPFTRLGKLRSAGITDLRHGNLIDDDWQSADRFENASDSRQPALMPPHIECHAVAATLVATIDDQPNSLRSRLVGDGLVPVASALGHHDDAGRHFNIPESNQHVLTNTGHVELIDHPEVHAVLARWLNSR